MNKQTQEQIHKALMHLHSLDADRAREKNGEGFSKADSQLGHIAANYPSEFWSEDLYTEMSAILVKYLSTQLQGIVDAGCIRKLAKYACGREAIHSAIDSIKKIRHEELMKSLRRISFDGESFFIAWDWNDPSFEDIKDDVREISGRRWGGASNKQWSVPLSSKSDVEALAAQYGFNLYGFEAEVFSEELPPEHRIEWNEDKGQFQIFFPYSPVLVDAVKSVRAARSFCRETKSWSTSSVGIMELIRETQVDWHLSTEATLRLNKTKMLRQQDEVSYPLSDKLFPYQVKAVEYLQAPSNRSALLTDEMGLGKTIEVLSALPAGAAALVICPASLKGNWAKEVKAWRPDLTPVVLKGRKSFRWPVPGQILIMNYELIPKPDDTPLLEEKITLIADEAHYLKNAKAARTKNFRILARAVRELRGRTWCMTGTPLITSPKDLYGVLHSAGTLRNEWDSFPDFARCWGGYKGRFGYEWNPSAIDYRARTKLACCSFGRKREDVLLDLPPKRFSTHEVKINRHLRIEGTVLDELRGCGTRILDIQKALQFHELATYRKEIAKAKIDGAMELAFEIIEGGGEPLVVFSAHVDVARQFGEQDGWACITGATPAEKRSRIVESFQAGKLKGIAGTIGAMGTGLTLTAAHRMIFVDLDWSPAINAQAEDRINRIGQHNPCEYIYIVSDCEVDKIIHRALTNKDQMIDHVDTARKAN